MTTGLLSHWPPMRHNCLMKNKAYITKNKILNAAIEILNTYPKASLGDIAVAAGVGRATLHRHFSNREELLQKLTLQAIKETNHAARLATQGCRSYAAALEKIFFAMVPLGTRHWFLSQEHVPKTKQITKKIRQQEQALSGLITEVKREGLFATNKPNIWIMEVFDHMIHAAWIMVKKHRMSTDEAANLAWNTVVSGLQDQADYP